MPQLVIYAFTSIIILIFIIYLSTFYLDLLDYLLAEHFLVNCNKNKRYTEGNSFSLRKGFVLSRVCHSKTTSRKTSIYINGYTPIRGVLYPKCLPVYKLHKSDFSTSYILKKDVFNLNKFLDNKKIKNISDIELIRLYPLITKIHNILGKEYGSINDYKLSHYSGLDMVNKKSPFMEELTLAYLGSGHFDFTDVINILKKKNDIILNHNKTITPAKELIISKYVDNYIK